MTVRPRVIMFRTDAGVEIGLGHLRRCLALAEELRKQSAKVHFVIPPSPVAQEALLAHRFDTISVLRDEDKDLTQTLRQTKRWNAQVLIVDSYAVRIEQLAGLHSPVVVAIDDLADRLLPVPMVINGAPNAWQLLYRTSPRTRLLVGPKYLLLREEFCQEPNRLIRKRVERVLITLGGMDRLALMLRLVHWTRDVLEAVNIDVVVGPYFSPAIVSQLEQLALKDPLITLHKNPQKIRDLMLACDVAVTGGGQTTYELAATGTPGLAIQLADNQTQNLTGLSSAGVLIWAGDALDADLEDKTKRMLTSLAGDPARRAAQSQQGRTLVDGQGARRVACAILDLGTTTHP